MDVKRSLSIIVPHKNSPECLSNLLESIFNEASKEKTQVIVVDDNSTNKTDGFSIVKEKYAGRVEFYNNNRSNPGAGAARNAGLEHAEGKWLLFADVDDYFVKGWYEIVESNFNDDNDIIYFIPTSIDLKTGKPSTRHESYEERVNDYIENPNQKNEDRLRFEYIVPWSKLYRRTVVEKNNILFDEVMYSNDVMFSVKFGYHAEKIKVSKEVIYCVTKGADSLTTRRAEANLLQRHLVLCDKYNYLKMRITKERFYSLYIGLEGYILVNKAFRCLDPKKRNFKYFIQYLHLKKRNKVKLPPANYLIAHLIKKIKHKSNEEINE